MILNMFCIYSVTGSCCYISFAIKLIQVSCNAHLSEFIVCILNADMRHLFVCFIETSIDLDEGGSASEQLQPQITNTTVLRSDICIFASAVQCTTAARDM